MDGGTFMQGVTPRLRRDRASLATCPDVSRCIGSDLSGQFLRLRQGGGREQQARACQDSFRSVSRGDGKYGPW